MEYSFIMYQTGRVLSAEKPGHLIDIFSAVRFIATGPDQDRRMILISLVHGIRAVQHCVQPFRFVVRHNIIVVSRRLCRIPGSV